MSVYGRLGFDSSFDTTLFNNADTLTSGVLNLLGNTSINLSDWQIQDLSNATVNGYYQNPHNDNLGVISVFLTGISLYANTSYYTYSNPDVANNVLLAASSSLTSLTNFTNHTNNLSGVTRSSDISVYPDLNSGLSIGRQILNITNKTDGVQNNIPMLGTFTSLYIGNTLTSLASTITNDYITLSNSFTGTTSNVSNSTMNTIISHIQSLQTQIDARKNSDISFYVNSYGILQEYQTVSQFSNLGATQNSLITLIGTDKLKADLS